MKKKAFTPEQIIGKLREAEVKLSLEPGVSPTNLRRAAAHGRVSAV